MAAISINLFHIFGVAPALGYVFYENYNGRALSSTAAMIGLVVVLLVALYHGYLIYGKSVAPTGVTDSGVSTSGAATTSQVDPRAFTQGAKVNGGTDTSGAIGSHGGGMQAAY